MNTPTDLTREQQQETRRQLDAARDKALHGLNQLIKVQRAEIWTAYWMALDQIGLDHQGRAKAKQ